MCSAVKVKSYLSLERHLIDGFEKALFGTFKKVGNIHYQGRCDLVEFSVVYAYLSQTVKPVLYDCCCHEDAG